MSHSETFFGGEMGKKASELLKFVHFCFRVTFSKDRECYRNLYFFYGFTLIYYIHYMLIHKTTYSMLYVHTVFSI